MQGPADKIAERLRRDPPANNGAVNDTERPRRQRPAHRPATTLDEWRKFLPWVAIIVAVFLGLILWKWATRPPTQIINEAAVPAPVEQPVEYSPSETEIALSRLDPFNSAPWPMTAAAMAIIGNEPDLEQPLRNITRAQYVFWELVQLNGAGPVDQCEVTLTADPQTGLKVFAGPATDAVRLFDCDDPALSVAEILHGDQIIDPSTTSTEVPQ